MIDAATELVEALTAAYRPHVLRGLDRLGAECDEACRRALDAGEAWLADRLESLLSLPFAEQRRGPLEVFQEAMRFPTEALETVGVTAPTRDPVAAGALPGDRFDLAPASSNQLGDTVWRAHLAWGAAKAAAMRSDPS